MTPEHRRILVADDLPSIHEDYRKILAPAAPTRPPFAAFAEPLPATPELPLAEPSAIFDLDFVHQGQAAVDAVAAALAASRPFALAFLDVRMPPGIDGIETARRLRALDPDLQIVLCTAYSDYSLDDLARLFPESDGLLILKKPFDPVEVQQLARSLCRKWRLAGENRALLRDLEQRVAARTSELTIANSRLETALRAAQAANQAKSEFLANMSHEIRTPLNAVLGMSELLQASPLSPDQREYTETIRTSGDALLSVLNGILDFSKIEHGQLELEDLPYDLPAVLSEALEIIRPQAAPRALTLRLVIHHSLPRHLRGDPSRLRQILLNLLANAAKFTDQGEVVLTASRRTSPGGEDLLHLSVRDTGIGIPPDRHDRLFLPFSQVDASTTRKYGGTGLGLAITRRLATLMGGRIWVESTPGLGSDFQLEIPLRLHAFPPPAPPAEYTPDPSLPLALTHPLRILLVEDNVVNQRVASLLLRKMGYSPDCALNGAEALAAVAAQPYDVLLLDVQMPVMDGLEAARRLCAEYPPARRPWIIAMTANALEGDREACLAAGMDDYTSKPARSLVIAAALARAHAALATRRA